jgi:hypothetical protein
MVVCRRPREVHDPGIRNLWRGIDGDARGRAFRNNLAVLKLSRGFELDDRKLGVRRCRQGDLILSQVLA